MNADLLPLFYGMIVGISLGLTGGGGAIFAVPLLVYGIGMSVREAVGISLATVGMTSLFGTILKARARQVEYKTAFLFALTGMLGAPLGVRLGSILPERGVLISFALLMVMVGMKMWRGKAPQKKGSLCLRDAEGRIQWGSPCLLLLSTSGLLTGILSGVFGVGGGFIIVPVLVFFTQMSVSKAVGSSLLVISLISLSGMVSIVTQGVPLPLEALVIFGGGSLIGMMLGLNFAPKLSERGLKKLFAIAMWAVAVVMLSQSEY